MCEAHEKTEPPRIRADHHRRRRRRGRRSATLFGQAPTVMTPKSVKPVVIASSNGNQFKNGGSKTCVENAFSMITGGSDVLDALVAGVNIVELDPLDDSVGYGGLPNAEGVVQLDSLLHARTEEARRRRRRQSKACATPSKVAQLVMDQTDHHLLVGKGAQDFARSMGFKIEDDLNTENSRGKWLEWKRRTDPLHYLSPKDRAAGVPPGRDADDRAKA